MFSQWSGRVMIMAKCTGREVVIFITIEHSHNKKVEPGDKIMVYRV